MTQLQQSINKMGAASQEKPQKEKSQARKDYELGLDFFERGDLAQAANMFHNALIGFDQEKDINGKANATDKLADICAQRKEADKAVELYGKVIAICQAEGDSASIFSVEKKMAKLYADCGMHDQAISSYMDIMDEYNAMRNPQGTVDTLEALAAVYVECGRKEEAADCYRTAARIHERYKHKRHAEAFIRKAEMAVNND